MRKFMGGVARGTSRACLLKFAQLELLTPCLNDFLVSPKDRVLVLSTSDVVFCAMILDNMQNPAQSAHLGAYKLVMCSSSMIFSYLRCNSCLQSSPKSMLQIKFHLLIRTAFAVLSTARQNS